MKALRNGQSKLIIISNNCPAIRKAQLEYMAILGGSKVLHFEGNNVELGKSTNHSRKQHHLTRSYYSIGTAVSRMHRVCVLTIQDAGDSDILTAVVN